MEEKKKKKKKKAEEPVNEEVGMTILEARGNTHDAVPPIPVTDEDTLTALLHATKARNLPEIASQLRTQRAIRAALPIRRLEGETGDPKDRFYGHQALPLLNPNMTMSAITAIDRDRKTGIVQNILKTKPDTNKAVLWTALRNAKKSALLVSKPAPGSLAAQEAAARATNDDDLETVVSTGGTTTKKVPKSYTVSGLKRFSQKQTAKALKQGGLIRGVLTHENDPFVSTLCLSLSLSLSLSLPLSACQPACLPSIYCLYSLSLYPL